MVEEAKALEIDALVNNEAMVCPSITLGEYDDDLIDSMIEVNLKAPIMLTKNLLPNLKRIINIVFKRYN